MTSLLIVNSDTPALIAATAARGDPDLGASLGTTFQQIEADVQFQTVAPYCGEALVLGGIDGVAFTGSAVEWNTGDSRAAPLAWCMEQVFASGLPVFGVCNGLQLAASVLGAEVSAAPSGRENGLARQIRLTPEGRNHPMMAGRGTEFSALCSHRDGVRRLPDGAVLLAGNQHSAVQAFVYEKDGVDFWGCQYHPEFTLEYAADVLSRRDDVDAEFIADLRLVKTDETAAARLGISAVEMMPPVRVTEFRNWLGHVSKAAGND